MTALESLAELLTQIRDRLGVSAGTNSVAIKTSTRGVDVEVKVHTESPSIPVTVAGDAAMDEFLRVNQTLTARIKDYQL